MATAGLGEALSALGQSLHPVNVRRAEEAAAERERLRKEGQREPFRKALAVAAVEMSSNTPNIQRLQEAATTLLSSDSAADQAQAALAMRVIQDNQQRAGLAKTLEGVSVPTIGDKARSSVGPLTPNLTAPMVPESDPFAAERENGIAPPNGARPTIPVGATPAMPQVNLPPPAEVSPTLNQTQIRAPNLADPTTRARLQSEFGNYGRAAVQEFDTAQTRARADEDRARTVANQKKQDDARAWLGSAEGIALLDRATKPQRDRNGSLMYDEAAQIQFAQRWRDAGYTTDPPLPESKIFAPQQRQMPRDNEMEKLAILSRMVDDQGNFIPAAMQLAQIWGVNLGGQQPAQGLTAEVLIAQAKAELNKPTASNAEIASVIRSDISNASAEDRPIYDAALRSLESQGSPVGTEGEQPQKSIGDLQRELNDAKIKHLDAWNRLQRLGGKNGGSNALPGETAQEYEDRELRRREVQSEQEELQSQIQSLQEQIRTYRTTAARSRRVRQIEYGR